MRLILTAAVAALVLTFAGSAADAKKAKSKTYNISCPALAPVPMKMGTCKGTRESCQTKHQMCYVADQPKKAKKAKGKKKSKK
jgi:hypothetical protein